MNMQNLMAQARKLQNDIERVTKEIEDTTYVGENSGIKVQILGSNKVTKIEIINDEVLLDKELLEDMILLAVNDALDKIKKDKEEKLGKYTKGLPGLF